MDEAKGEINVMAANNAIKSHLRESAKFKGISGSS
jgi:hypothetical protein